MVNTAKNHVSVFRVLPIAPERTQIEIHVYQTPLQRDLYPIDLKALRKDVDRDMEEDFVICRFLQAGVRSRAYRVVALAEEHELGVGHFYKVIREYLDGTSP